MRPLSLRLISYFREWSLRRRIAGLAAAILINALLLLMLLTLAPYTPGRKTDDGGLVTFTVAPPAPPATEQKATQQPTVHAQARTAPPPPVPPPPPVTSLSDLGVIPMNHNDITQVDTAMNAPPVQRPSQENGSETRTASGSDTPVAGKGAHGETLYYARWYREPTDAEMNTYLPKSRPLGSYATIACRTVARFHVEDCYGLEESPSGSGMMRGVLNASWQFLVVPPKVGGRTLIGEWVRISIIISREARDKAADQ